MFTYLLDPVDNLQNILYVSQSKLLVKDIRDFRPNKVEIFTVCFADFQKDFEDW